MFKKMKDRFVRAVYQTARRDNFIQKSVGNQEKSKIEQFAFQSKDGSILKIQVWAVYNLVESSPFDAVMKTMTDGELKGDTSIVIQDKDKNTMIQITPTHGAIRIVQENDLKEAQEATVRSIERLNEELEKNRWDYYHNTIQATKRILIRTPLMCIASFLIGCLLSSVIQGDFLQFLTTFASFFAGSLFAYLLGMADFQSIMEARQAYIDH